ncbi:hypothetical protein Enr10x_18440 [Gimesia panareensis]|uniref:Uncharacterized protein n=1 Tax=Gimesia panareensis TaxID=2527978 RepID=A0A517Q4K8_9PLAN|nr:hypothetical protein Enr10x_18440 [Gimesia panareensis]QDU50581.1 hypothetical protein Pan110_29330 [Gimesia panareensis]
MWGRRKLCRSRNLRGKVSNGKTTGLLIGKQKFEISDHIDKSTYHSVFVLRMLLFSMFNSELDLRQVIGWH